MSDYKEQVNSLREHADLIETSIELYGPSATRLLVYDLRNAAAAIDALQKTLEAVRTNSGINFRMWQEAQAEVERLQAQLPKRGEWVKAIWNNAHILCRCSVCGNEMFTNPDYVKKHKYCFNCGAKMEVSE